MAVSVIPDGSPRTRGHDASSAEERPGRLRVSSQDGDAILDHAPAESCYDAWPSPTVLIVDGPYGVSGYPGDPPTPRDLGDWYEPHIAAWAARALPETTLWFWNTEVGWANVHPVLESHDWEYKSAHVWDKGVGHIAGNVNGNTIRRFPVVSEVCVQYVRTVKLETDDGRRLPLKEWLRAEWRRSGLPLMKTNEACGVKNAATRKYFTQCHLWYFPPAPMMEMLASYASAHGRATDRPYFSLDGHSELTADQWAALRAKWNHVHGITNVWREPANRGDERLKNGLKSLHGNQKPLRLMERIIAASSDPGDVVWDPFGGLCTGAVASLNLGRRCFSAESSPEFYAAGAARLTAHADDLAEGLIDVHAVPD